jgi:hypothetical protein
MGRAGLVDLMIQHQPAQKGPLVMPGEIIFELSASPSGVVKPSTETNQTTDHSTIRGSNGSRASGEAVPARALTTVEQQTPLYLPQPPSPVAVSTGNKRRKTGTNNREPQKRYIAKQEAKKQETELLLRKLSEDIESVRVENAQLNSTNDVLQKALSVRDDHIKILEYTKDNKIDPTSTSIFVTARAPPLTPQWNSPGTAHQVDCSQNPIQKASCMAAAAFASGPSKSKGEQLKMVKNLPVLLQISAAMRFTPSEVRASKQFKRNIPLFVPYSLAHYATEKMKIALRMSKIEQTNGWQLFYTILASSVLTALS